MLKKRLVWTIIVTAIILSGAFVAAVRYKSIEFRDSQIDEIIFYFNNGLAAGKSDNVWQAVWQNLPLALGVSVLFALPLSSRFTNWIALLVRKAKSSTKTTRSFALRLRYKLIYSTLLFLITAGFLLQVFSVPAYVIALTQTSDLYETHYVDPKSTQLTFPKKKRNLIYIFVESLENTVMSRTNGGQADSPIAPELEKLALENTSFSHAASGLGGAQAANGTTFTVGGMAAQSAGVPLKETIFGQDHNSMGQLKEFLPGAHSLGDILKQHGYNQSFLMGSDAAFGGRDKLLSQHGDYNVLDLNWAHNNSKLPKEYKVWWGFEDKKLFEFAKTEATQLAQSDKPFNLQLLTADTHFTDGYLDETCTKKFANQYDNVHACSSKQIADFVAWVRKQPFADNTTIVISGDHLGMQTAYYDAKITTPNYQRSIYNVFINPAAKPGNTHNRQFSSFDMYPSTLAAMGVKIDGDRLALGTNLFSNQQTLVEQLGGINHLNTELSKRSAFYERRIFSLK